MCALRLQRGATIIEFALVAFFFFLIMAGILEFGRAFYVRNTTQHLTRCIAREAVVRLPSQSDAAKQACLLSTGSSFFWPFFELSANDMRNLFTVSYIFKDGGSVTEPGSGPLDHQVLRCMEGNTQCIADVQVCLAPGYLRQEFGYLRPFMTNPLPLQPEPENCTTMPAEAMGASVS